MKTESPTGEAHAATGPRGTVLVMDDDAATRDLLAELLAGEGYSVLEAANGEQGLRLARQLDPKVILLDLQLPPTSGLDVLDALRAGGATRHIPVVVVSGQPLGSEEGGSPGPEGVIRKPFDLGDLLAHVERLASLGEEHR